MTMNEDIEGVSMIFSDDNVIKKRLTNDFIGGDDDRAIDHGHYHNCT